MISRFLATSAIRGYQKWVSPYKGYRCAHHVVHGDGTCSQFGLEVFGEYSFFEAWNRLKERFAECKKANIFYHSPEQEEERRKKKRQESGFCDDCSSPGNLSCVEIPDFGACVDGGTTCVPDLDGCGSCQVGDCS